MSEAEGYDKTESSGEKYTSDVRWCAAVSGGGSSVQFNTNTNNNEKKNSKNKQNLVKIRKSN